MPHSPQPLRFHAAEHPRDPLVSLGNAKQALYARSYLFDLDCRVIVEEPYYFDHDYLAEFGAFYGTSARGYTNVCRRLTLFDVKVTDVPTFRRHFEAALSGDQSAAAILQAAFLGFVVLRPIPAAPFGRTVLRSYPPKPGVLDRVMEPCRDYTIHLAGMPLVVRGVAWQQQDRGVSACATIALWTMLHSSAFHERHALPTTVSITLAAHKTASLGSRVFPSDGLLIEQILEAIKEHQLSPIVMEGDKTLPTGAKVFTKERFCGSCAALLRSGYPVLISGIRNGGHAVCAVGFRPMQRAKIAPGSSGLEDSNFEHVYIHDDNLGASVRFKVEEDAATGAVNLVPDAPSPGPRGPRPVVDPCVGVAPLVPRSIVVAVHREVRVEPDKIHAEALERAELLSYALQAASFGEGVSVAPRFVLLSRYLNEELRTVVAPKDLARVRLTLCEDVAPMSYHVAVARFGLPGVALMDVIFDTTDSELNCAPFAHVVFSPMVDPLLDAITQSDAALRDEWFGTRVQGF
jgi:hypothetical protein